MGLEEFPTFKSRWRHVTDTKLTFKKLNSTDYKYSKSVLHKKSEEYVPVGIPGVPLLTGAK